MNRGEIVRFELDGAIATITLNRPDAANAQNSELIDALDAAFDRAEVDDNVRVVVLAAEGKHFSAGHDLKELLAGEEYWAAMRDTPEGKLRHEQVMYFDKLVKIRDFRKVTIAAVQGACSAAGMMLACMCDLIVAADDARFSNPVLRMSGVGVELLVEPWELGPRKAKEFLFCAQELSAQDAERYGLVNRVVPRAELAAEARAMAESVALVPPLTAEAVKASINNMIDGMGQRESWRYHFMLHQFVSNTPTALAKVEARKQGGMDAVKKEQAGERGMNAGAPREGPLTGIRVLDLGTRIAAPFCAGLLGEQGAEVIKIEQPGAGDFIRDIGPFALTPEGEPYSLFWAVEGRGRKSVTLDLRKPEGQDVLRRLAATADVLVENFRPGTLEQWNVAPGNLHDRLITVRISMFGQDGPYSPRPGLDRVGIGYGGLLNLTGYPEMPPVRVGVTISDYLTGVFAAHAASAALYGREVRGQGGAVIDAALYGSVLRILEWTLAGYDRLGITRTREGNRLANSAPLDNYPTADGKYVCIVAGSDANFARLCAAMERSDLLEDPRFAKLSDRAEHGDVINGIVADWTSKLSANTIETRCVEHDVPVATAYTAADIFGDPHFALRGDIVNVSDPTIGPVRQQAPYPRRVGETPATPTGAPMLGAHTDEVLATIGCSPDEIEALRDKGIV